MAKIYGNTLNDPAEAPKGIVGDVSALNTSVLLPLGFSIPSAVTSTAGNLTVAGTLSVSNVATFSNIINNTSNTTNLSVLNVTGAATFSSTVAISGSISSNILPSTNNALNLGSASYNWANGYIANLQSTTVNATSVNVSGTLTAAALSITGSISLSNINIVNTTSLSTLNVTGETSLYNAVTFSSNAKIKSSIVPNIDNQYNLGSTGVGTTYRWANGYFNSLYTSNTLTTQYIKFSGSTYSYDSENTPLTFFKEGAVILSLNGISTTATAELRYIRIGSLVVFASRQYSSFSGTSNSTTMTLTPNLPDWLKPASTVIVPHIVTDNGVAVMGKLHIGSDGSMTFYKDVNGGAFTGSGTKGLPMLSASYRID